MQHHFILRISDALSFIMGFSGSYFVGFMTQTWDRARAARVIARIARQNALIRSLWWLEVKDCNENRHEGGHGHC